MKKTIKQIIKEEIKTFLIEWTIDDYFNTKKQPKDAKEIYNNMINALKTIKSRDFSVVLLNAYFASLNIELQKEFANKYNIKTRKDFDNFIKKLQVKARSGSRKKEKLNKIKHEKEWNKLKSQMTLDTITKSATQSDSDMNYIIKREDYINDKFNKKYNIKYDTSLKSMYDKEKQKYIRKLSKEFDKMNK